MTLEVRVVTHTSVATLNKLHQMAVDSHDPAFQCAAGRPYPSRNEFAREAQEHALYGVFEGSTAMGFLIVKENGRVRWLFARPAGWRQTVEPLIARLIADFGDVIGTVENPAIQQIVLTLPGVAVKDGDTLTGSAS